MNIVLIILVALGYAAIGGFMCGIIGDQEDMLWYICFWPIFIAFTVIVAVVTLPFWIGKKISEKVKQHDKLP